MEVPKEKLGFQAIAVVAAIDMKGRVVTMVVKEKSINIGSFIIV